MHRYDDERLGEIEARLLREDPRFARALGAGRPRRPREYRHTRAWLVLAVGLAVLVAGIILAQGLLIGLGLVTTGAAGHLFDPLTRSKVARSSTPRLIATPARRGPGRDPRRRRSYRPVD